MSVKVTVDLLKGKDIKPVGCRICGGELVPALSLVKKGDVANTFTCVGHSFATGRFVACDSQGMYVSTDGLDFIKLATASGRGFALEDVYKGKPRALMLSGFRCLAHDGGGFIVYGNPSNLYCGAVHCGRLFGIDADNRYILRWSKSGVNDWEEGINGAGKLVLDPERGAGLDIVSYGGNLIVIRQYGLTVLKMYGSPENFSVNITDTDCDEIYEGTAKTVLGKLYFYTSSGLKVYDGSVIKRVSHRLENEIALPICAAEYGGKYYLACNLKEGGKGILCYDPDDGESYLISGGVNCLCRADGVYAYDNTAKYKLEKGGEYTFSSGKINFGTDEDKTVLSLRVDGARADITISNGTEKLKYTNVSGIIRPRLKGAYFTVEVKGVNTLRSITATAEVANAV
ncbi:MAG: hypothetical protein K2L12_07390 [Clostridia bacterium]|nr:hypothetical protein [Clostridia bacterium]